MNLIRWQEQDEGFNHILTVSWIETMYKWWIFPYDEVQIGTFKGDVHWFTYPGNKLVSVPKTLELSQLLHEILNGQHAMSEA